MPWRFFRLPPQFIIGCWMAGMLLLGLLIGAAWGLAQLPAKMPITMVPDARPRTGVVRIEGIRDGALIGTMTGDVRLFAGDRLMVPGSGGLFWITDRSILTNTLTVRAPMDMQFVASKQGRKYYPIGSPEANRLAPANRIYFPDAAAAERAGYVHSR